MLLELELANYHLLVEDAPKWALGHVDKGCMAFFWAGTEDIHVGKCLMAWQWVCLTSLAMA